MGHEHWPWPQNGPQQQRGTKWWKSLHPSGSIASRVRRFEIMGDVVLVGAIGFFFLKALTSDSVYQTRNSFLTGHPPALVAQEFNFTTASENRTVSRETLQEYRDELATARSVWNLTLLPG